jgi:hypothetical protein
MSKLIELVAKQIQEDLEDGNVDCLEHLLEFVPVENLKSYLPEALQFLHEEELSK